MDKELIIEFKNASIFQKSELILTKVNLSIYKGDFVYVIGKVGSGKSSLVKTIITDIPLKGGEGYVAGYDLNNIKRKEIPLLRRKIGVVFQDLQLLSDRNVSDNLKFVLAATGWKDKFDIERRIIDVLDLVGLRDKRQKLPHELSGGEQQRVVIARALLNNPDIILADEPTGNLDPESSEQIFRLLFDISHTGKAVLLVTHNYVLIEKFPARILKCDKNKILEIEKLLPDDDLIQKEIQEVKPYLDDLLLEIPED